MKRNLQSLRSLLPVFLTFLILFEAAAYTAITPAPRATFFQFYVLGPNRMASNYYPNNSAYISVGEHLTWNIGVVNQMGSMQYVDVRVKLGNQTIDPPNETTSTPSPAPLVAEFKQFVQDNGTIEIPFIWKILNFTTTKSGQPYILQLQIDDVTYSLQNSPVCSSFSSCRLRLVFELWTWNVNIGDFQIGWWSGDQRRIAWLQLWFYPIPGAI